MVKWVVMCLVLVALAGCGSVKASYQVVVTPETLKMIKAQPEFTGVECAPGTRIALAGAEVSRGSLLLSINCVDF